MIPRMIAHDEHADDSDSIDAGAVDDDDSPAEMICPSCSGPVIEDTQQCPHCGDWITPADPARSGWRRIVWVAVVLLMALIMLSLAF